jgi:hypothetical protein
VIIAWLGGERAIGFADLVNRVSTEHSDLDDGFAGIQRVSALHAWMAY